MGLLDKLKGAVNAVTGGAATVEIEWNPAAVVHGSSFDVTVTVRSTGDEVKSDGIFVDVVGEETVLASADRPDDMKRMDDAGILTDALGTELSVETIDDGIDDDVDDEDEASYEEDSTTFLSEAYRLCDAFTLGKDETKVVTGQIPLAADLTPTSETTLGCHYAIRGRLEAFGNDPDSGYKELIVK